MSLHSELLTKDALKEAMNELGTLKAVGRKFGVASGTIKTYMLKHGLKVPAKRRYDCDHIFFSRDSEESFYVAGFIAADGGVSDKGVLSIGLASKDRPQLEMTKRLLKAENPIGEYLVKNSKINPKWNDCKKVEMKITSSKMCTDLKRFNVVPRKTLTLKFPEWMKSHPLRHHFIRGYFDGDGSFYSSLKNDGTRTVEQIYFSLRGTDDFLTAVKDIFNKEIDLSDSSKKKQARLNSGIYSLEYGGNRILEKIVDYLYKDSTVHMDRKYKIGIKAKDLGDPRDFNKICNKEDIERLYLKHQSLEKVANDLGVNLSTIHKYAVIHNISLAESTGSKNKRFQKLLSKEAIEKAYGEHGSVKKAAESLSVGPTTFSRYAAKHGAVLAC
jgi:hypothetical protein